DDDFGYSPDASIFSPTQITRRKSRVVRGQVISPSDQIERNQTYKSHFDKRIESLNYVSVESDVRFIYQKMRSERSFRVDDVRRWLTVILIGFFTALVAWAVHYFVEIIFNFKFSIMEYFVHFESHAEVHLGYLIYVSMNLSLVIIGSSVVIFLWPEAAGSGLPEVKSYLNGVRVPKALNIFTMITKFISVICSVSASLAVGPEGPMIHIGALIGGGFAEWKSRTFGFALPLMQNFRNSRDRRDFILSGSAAGIAAAFGSPIGGVLFALEETSSHWSQALTWRTFFGTMIATFTVNIFLSLVDEGRFNVKSTVIFDMGRSEGFTYYELPIFVILGVFGGCTGSIFTFLNVKLMKFRTKYLHFSKAMRMIEVMFIVILTSTVWFYISFLGGCRPREDGHRTSLVSFICPPNSYNEFASLFLVPPENAIRHLFYRGKTGEFGMLVPAVFSALYFIMSVITSGASIASGTFVPMILVGAGYGRFFGTAVKNLFPDLDIDPGTYALIGASSFMGGVSRMTISLTVILLEITNDLQYLLPIMLTLMISKWTGDFFSKPLYDAQIDVKNIPYLEGEPSFEMTKLRNIDVMVTPVCTIPIKATVGDIINTLQTTAHHGFPIVDEKKRYIGIISRSYLLLVLKYIVIGGRIELTQKEVQHYLEDLPRILLPPLLNQIEETHYEMTINLESFVNRSCLTVSDLTSVSVTFELFRSMSLRHLPVTNHKNEVVGFLTRKDLVHDRIEFYYEKNKHKIKPPKMMRSNKRRY
ncbi:12 TM domain-containing transmembrane protein, partial [Acrasis kona]